MAKQRKRADPMREWLVDFNTPDAQLNRLYKEAYNYMLSVLDSMEDGGSLWQLGFWAGRVGLGKPLDALAQHYREVGRGRHSGEFLGTLVERIRKGEERLEGGEPKEGR